VSLRIVDTRRKIIPGSRFNSIEVVMQRSLRAGLSLVVSQFFFAQAQHSNGLAKPSGAAAKPDADDR